MKSIDLSSIDLNLLVVFEAIFETQGVTTAAQALHLGQPAVSAALGRLRVLFADELFIRIGREMQPTAKALHLAPEIAAALQQIRQTLEASQTFDPTTSERTFVIGISDYASAVILPKLLTHCQQAAPGLDFRLKSFDKDQVEVMLEQREIAVAIGTFQTVPRQILQCLLMQETFVGICRQNHPAIAQW